MHFSAYIFVFMRLPPRNSIVNCVCVYICLIIFLFSLFLYSPGKGEDKEYPTIGARMIRLEDKVGTLLPLSVRVFCLK